LKRGSYEERQPLVSPQPRLFRLMVQDPEHHLEISYYSGKKLFRAKN
jgi:hypothetical protein